MPPDSRFRPKAEALATQVAGYNAGLQTLARTQQVYLDATREAAK